MRYYFTKHPQKLYKKKYKYIKQKKRYSYVKQEKYRLYDKVFVFVIFYFFQQFLKSKKKNTWCI